MSGARRHRPRRGHGDHHLSRAGDDLGAAGQRRRSLPGRRADLEALRLRGAAVGADQDRIDRRDGRGRLGDPRRCARPRGDAHPAAHQRRRERGVDLRQDAPRRRRAAHAAARPALHPRGRPAAAGDAGSEAFAAIAAQGAGRASPERIGAIAGDLAAVEEMFALKAPDGARSASPNIDCRQDGAALDPRSGRASYLFNADHRRHRAGRRAADRRRQPAPRGVGAQCAHPQALARRQVRRSA